MTRNNIEAIYPLSPLQQGMLFHTLYDRKSGVYFGQFQCMLQGQVNPAAVRWAWQQAVDRHPILRTAFVWDGLETPLQVVGRSVTVKLVEEDWRDLARDSHQERLQGFLEKDRADGFDLTAAPLMRLFLIRVSHDSSYFVWSRPLMLLDGWSVSLLLNEISAFYESYCRGEVFRPGLPRPYEAYITWLQKQDLSRAENYWRETLKSFTRPTPLNVGDPPLDRAEGDGEFGEEELRLSHEATEAVQRLAKSHRLTVNILVQGAWALLLCRYSGEDDVVFGATVSGRPPELAGIDTMIGLFINTLPVRITVMPEFYLLPWLENIQERQAEMLQFEYSPLVRIQGWSDLPRGVSLFDSVVIFENFPVDASTPKFQGGVRTRESALFERTNYPLTLVAEPGPALTLKVLYNRRLFETGSIQQILRQIKTLLEEFATRPDRRLFEFPIATEQGSLHLIDSFNADLEAS
jgi:surfactin family lipopeptide synthetase C